jgi:hypothetical protein
MGGPRFGVGDQRPPETAVAKGGGYGQRPQQTNLAVVFHPHNANQFAVTAGSEKVDPDIVLQVCDGQITRRQKCLDVIV